MSEDEKAKHQLIGTPAYDNWRAFLDGAQALGSYEYQIYTDARLTGEVAVGVEPYQFFNLVPVRHLYQPRGTVTAALTLRVTSHIDVEGPPMDKTDQSRYHGGWIADEIAALASLKCGVRFRAGGQTRRFELDDDPRGRPMEWFTRPEPSLSIGLRGFVLPGLTGEHSMMPVEGLKSFPMLKPEQAIALLRASRLYQDALWLSESEPNLSWLMLVAALETAANHSSSLQSSPVDRLKEAKPEFIDYLRDTGVPGIIEKVASEFADSIGSTKKFVDFLCTYCPQPPRNRPADWAQFDWSVESLRKAFRMIYGYRSKALHDGMPFPSPMCQPPTRQKEWSAFAEIPMGLAASEYGGSWLVKDTPMLLHTFEYIARNAINAWWNSMATL